MAELLSYIEGHAFHVRRSWAFEVLARTSRNFGDAEIFVAGVYLWRVWTGSRWVGFSDG